jgi:hypothetical protein
VNKWALDLYRQFLALQSVRHALLKSSPRYHVEFETISALRKKLGGIGFEDIVISGAMFAPLRPLHKLAPKAATSLARRTLSREAWLSNGALTRPFAGHLIVTARRPA